MISLSTPARSEFVHLLRGVAAGVGASVDLSFDEIDDLRLAVDEACAHLLKLEPKATALRLRIERRQRSLDVVVSLVAEQDGGLLPQTQQFLTWHILAALTDGAAVESTEDGPAIRFSKKARV